jgi:adenylosuccinate synthase
MTFVEKETGAAVGMISTGPDRDHTIFVDAFTAELKSAATKG